MIQDCRAVNPHCCFARLSELGSVTLLAINEKLLVCPVGRNTEFVGQIAPTDRLIIASSTVSQRLSLTQLERTTPQQTDEVLYSISSLLHMCTQNERPTKFAVQ